MEKQKFTHQEIIEKCKGMIDALVKFLTDSKRIIVYDWGMETFLVGPAGMKWNGCNPVPKGHEDATGEDTQAMFDKCRILPAWSVFYCNPETENYYTVDPKATPRPKIFRSLPKDPVLRRARQMAGELAVFAAKCGYSLMFKYGADYIGVVKGRMYANHRSFSPTEIEFFGEGSEPLDNREPYKETYKVSGTTMTVYSGDHTAEGELVAPTGWKAGLI